MASGCGRQTKYEIRPMASAIVRSTYRCKRPPRKQQAAPVAGPAVVATSDRIATTEMWLEGFYWVILGWKPPEIAYWERGEWWLAGRAQAVARRGGDSRQRWCFKPRLAPVA
jgi:hypothetical protein